MVRRQHDNRQPPARQVLVMPDILISRDHHLEPCLFSSLDQVAVCKSCPSGFRDGLDRKPG
jgi:hypothetical protein